MDDIRRNASTPRVTGETAAVALVEKRLEELRQYTSYRFVLVKRELQAILDAATRTEGKGDESSGRCL
jgi:hypothetical protein